MTMTRRRRDDSDHDVSVWRQPHNAMWPWARAKRPRVWLQNAVCNVTRGRFCRHTGRSERSHGDVNQHDTTPHHALPTAHHHHNHLLSATTTPPTHPPRDNQQVLKHNATKHERKTCRGLQRPPSVSCLSLEVAAASAAPSPESVARAINNLS